MPENNKNIDNSSTPGSDKPNSRRSSRRRSSRGRQRSDKNEQNDSRQDTGKTENQENSKSRSSGQRNSSSGSSKTSQSRRIKSPKSDSADTNADKQQSGKQQSGKQQQQSRRPQRRSSGRGKSSAAPKADQQKTEPEIDNAKQSAQADKQQSGKQQQQSRRPQRRSSPQNKKSQDKKEEQPQKEDQDKSQKSGQQKKQQQRKRPQAKPDKAKQTERKSETEDKPKATDPQKILKDFTIRRIPRAMQIKPEEKLDRSIMNIVEQVENMMNNEFFVQIDSRILVAVSGGVDSVVLLDTLAQLVEKMNIEIIVCHFNHNLREGDSDKDEKFVVSLAKQYGFDVHTGQGDVRRYSEKYSLGIEQAARKLRYRFLEKTARHVRADYIATAHNANDTAETFFLNLFRGAGLTGLSGIPETRQISKYCTLIRPMSRIKKENIIEFARARNLEWHEDHTNSLLIYSRNRVRHDLLPKLEKEYNPAIVDLINRTAWLFRNADEFIAYYVKMAVQRVVSEKGSDRFAVQIGFFQTYNEFIQGEIIQNALRKHFNQQPVSLNTIDRIIGLTSSPVGAMFEASRDFIVLRDRDKLIFSRKRPAFECNMQIDRTGKYKIGNSLLELKEIPKKDAKFTDDPTIEYFDADKLPQTLQLRRWEQGDTFRPVNFDGHVKVSDYLTNQKVSLLEKQQVLVLTNRVEIIWVCGFRMSDNFKVTKSTQNVIQARYQDNSQEN